jgi:hypothetical protein
LASTSEKRTFRDFRFNRDRERLLSRFAQGEGRMSCVK